MSAALRPDGLLRCGPALTLALMAGCALNAPRGQLAAECSGVPGDFRTPNDGGVAAVVAHAPGAPGERYVAKFRPPTSDSIPLLMVFDEHRDHVYLHTAPKGWLTHPAFERAQDYAFWGELVDTDYYLVPWFDRCNLQAILKRPIDLRAPPGGLLFVQYLTEDCRECDDIDAAIRDVMTAHPDTGFRWVQVTIPPNVGRLRASQD